MKEPKVPEGILTHSSEGQVVLSQQPKPLGHECPYDYCNNIFMHTNGTSEMSLRIHIS
jgi:hypothetical protein